MRPSAAMPSSPEKKKATRRGRPPKSRRKAQLALLEGCSTGKASTPHVLLIDEGEDITSKIMLLTQQHPQAICILAAICAVSTLTLHLPSRSGGFDNATYQGHFEIVLLSGSYLPADEVGPRNYTGGISIAVPTPCGDIFGGSVGGPLIAANPVQVIAGSFTYRATTAKNKNVATSKDSQLNELKVPWELEDASYPAGAETDEPFSPLPPFGWSRIEDVKLGHHGINSTNG